MLLAPTHILTDVEGTTTSLAFVRDTLFPYSTEALPEFVRRNQNDPEIARLLADARAYAGAELDLEALIERMLGWIATDRKITPLKALQGHIWADGYQRGAFQGHTYADVAPVLRAWQAAGKQLAVFSSGSIHAQKLLFAHTPDGDLSGLFCAHFDTRIGGKKEVDSYRRIVNELNADPERVLFLSDVVAELDAARAARIMTAAILRPGVDDDFGDHATFADFHDLNQALDNL
ncbi:MAG: acireductone synthase [Thioalkalivibrionaceae bacterium]